MLSLFSKTDDFIKQKMLSKTNNLKEMINLLIKTNDFIEKYKFANKKLKGVISGKIEIFPLVCSKYLSSWTGLGKSGHVRFSDFNVRSWQVRTCPISDFWSSFARFRSKNGILMNLIHDSASFLPEKLNNQVILTPNLNV